MWRTAIVGLGLGACFAPNPPTGAPCGGNGTCPAPLVCSPTTGTCERTEQIAIDAAATDDAPRNIDAPPGPRDAPPDAAIDAAIDAQLCFGIGLVMVCPTAPITSPLTTVTETIDTTTSSRCIAYTGTAPGSLCVIAGTSVSIPVGTTLRAVGTKPLVILATNSLSVAGTIDVASRRGQPSGAGAQPAACSAGTAATATQGGAGGSFGGRGGNGGDVLAAGPASATTTAVNAFRGGCRGGTGAGAMPGAGGNGGGAVYLIASSTITISGTVNASGSGAANAMVTAGGGGGGTGGMIGIDAPMVTALAGSSIFANGGGGGEGSTPQKVGAPGADPATPLAGAPGGVNGAKRGGDGGAGSAGVTITGAAGTNGGVCDRGGASGGGGGGGAGVIRVFPAQTLAGSVSPPST